MNGIENEHDDLVGTANDTVPSIYSYISYVISFQLWDIKNKYWIKLNLEPNHWITVT